MTVIFLLSPPAPHQRGSERARGERRGTWGKKLGEGNAVERGGCSVRVKKKEKVRKAHKMNHLNFLTERKRLEVLIQALWDYSKTQCLRPGTERRGCQFSLRLLSQEEQTALFASP